MPWTFAHPAAVLPLRSLCPRWLSWPGLVIGSLAPDLSYYVGAHAQWSAFCHTARGVVTLCLPVSLLLLLLVQRFCRPLTVLLPAPHREILRDQFRPPVRAAWPALMIAIVSILLGAASHLLWDSFTHAGRWGAALLPALNRPVFVALGQQVPLFNVLQHLSTAIGVAALAAVYWRAARARRPAAPGPLDALRRRRLLACAAGATAVGVVSAWLLTPATQSSYASHLLVHAVVWSTSCLAVLYTLCSLAWWRRRGDDA